MARDVDAAVLDMVREVEGARRSAAGIEALRRAGIDPDATPDELTARDVEANFGLIQRALDDAGATPENALLEEGRRLAWTSLEPAYAAAMDRGDMGAVGRLVARAEREAGVHTRGQLRRLERDRTPTGRIADHPDFRAFFDAAREDAWEPFAQAYERAVAEGNTAAAERIQARVDERARQRATVAMRTRLDFEAGRGPLAASLARMPMTLTGRENEPARENESATPGRDAVLAAGRGIDYAESATGLPPLADLPLPESPSPDFSRFHETPDGRHAMGDEPAGVPDTLTGRETAVPEEPRPSFWGRLGGMARGFFDPLGGFITPPPRIVMQSPGQTLTGRRMAPTPRRVSFEPADPEAAAIGRLFGAFGPAGRVAGAAIERGVRAAASRPAVTAPLAVGGITAATTAETQTPDPTQTTSEAIARLRRQQEQLQAEQRRLQEEGRRFDNLRTSDRDAVREAQEFLAARGLYGLRSDGTRVRPDGSWGTGTQEAINAFRERNARALRTAEEQLSNLARDLETQENRLRGFERDQRVREANRDLSLWNRIVRDYPTPAGFVTGVAAGPALRGAMTWGANALRRGRVARADELLAPGAARPQDIDARVGNVNQFFRMGGQRGNEPFRVDRTAPRGYSANPDQPPVSTLYPAGRQWRLADTGTTAAAGLEFGVAEYQLHRAQQELEEARAAADREPSEANIDRVQAAEVNVGLMTYLARAGLGTGVSYPLSATKLRYKYPEPALNRAEAEVMRLNRLLGPPAGGGGGRPPAAGPRGPRGGPGSARSDHVVPPGPAPAPGARETWVSPGGRQQRTRSSPDSPWQNERGRFTGPPRANWRRISMFDRFMRGDTALG